MAAVTATRLRQLLTPGRAATGPDSEAAPATRLTTIRLLAQALHQTACDIAARHDQPDPPASLATPLATLWARTLKFDAADPAWADRDRFVLSCPAGTPLLHALLQVTGHPGLDQLAPDRAEVPGRHEADPHPAIEAAAAPGGQAIAAAIGMAMAERALAARFGKSLVDHRVWAVADAAELASGLVQEAAALAGLHRLDRLVVMVDAGQDEDEDARPVFAALGWAVKAVDGQDAEEVEAALSFALRSRKPTLVWCRGRADPPSARGRGPANPLEAWRRVGARGSVARRAWLKRLVRHPQRMELERLLAGRLPDQVHETLAALREQAGRPAAPAAQCHAVLDRLAGSMPELCEGRLGVLLKTGRGRPHGMLGCLCGMALHGAVLPVGQSALHELPAQLPALRMAALQGLRLIQLVIDTGGPGGAWQPDEALAWLRAIPGLLVFRPACAEEALECVELALRHVGGPSVLVLADHALPTTRADAPGNRCAAGGYVVAAPAGRRDATLIATGPGLPAAIEAGRLLADQGIAAAIVSLPCWELFAQQDAALRETVLGPAPRFGLEGGSRDGWDRWLSPDGTFIAGTFNAGTCIAGSGGAGLGALAQRITATVQRSL